MQSKQYAEYEESVLWQLKFRHKENTIDCPVIMTALYYMPNRKSWPDLIGLLCHHCGRTGGWSTTKDGVVNLFNDDDIARKVKGNVDFNTRWKHCKSG